MSGSGSAEIANTVNLAVLAGVVAAICYAMMRVDGADLFPVAPEVEPAQAVRRLSNPARPTRNSSMR